MTELLRVALRASVWCFRCRLWAFVAVTSDVSSDDVTERSSGRCGFRGSLPQCGPRSTRRVLPGAGCSSVGHHSVVVGTGLGIVLTLFAPARLAGLRHVYGLLFWCVPLLAAAGLGVVIGMAVAAINNRARRRHEAAGRRVLATSRPCCFPPRATGGHLPRGAGDRGDRPRQQCVGCTPSAVVRNCSIEDSSSKGCGTYGSRQTEVSGSRTTATWAETGSSITDKHH